MITRREASATLLGAISLAAIRTPNARAQQVVKLPAPQTDGGKPMMQALKSRRSVRDYSDRPLPPQVLSNLLWAACGINRPDAGLRTAPSWRGRAHVDLYLAMADGTWVYDAKAHRLVLHMQDDVRAETTTEQPFVSTAPLSIVYVADTRRLGETTSENQVVAGVADSAVIAQNIYLFCASEGLVTVIRGLVPRERLAKRLKLSTEQKIYLAQTIGYPK